MYYVVLYGIIWYYMALYGIKWYYMVLYGTMMYSDVLCFDSSQDCGQMLIGVADPIRDGPWWAPDRCSQLWNRPVVSQPEISSTIPIYHKYSNPM